MASPAAEVPSCSPCIKTSYKSPAAVVPEVDVELAAVTNEHEQRRNFPCNLRKEVLTPKSSKYITTKYKTKSPMPQTLPQTPETPGVDSPHSQEQVVPQLTEGRRSYKGNLVMRQCKRKRVASSSSASKDQVERPGIDLIDIVNTSYEVSDDSRQSDQ